MDESSENSGTNELEALDYLRGVKSSTCLLLPTTPSPTPLDFKHPLSEEMSGPFLTLNDDPNMVNIQADVAGDSSSSGDSNSVVQDPVSAQLINNISMLDYQTLSKNGDLIMGQTEDCKLNGNHIANNRKLPSFVNWNWNVIRKVLLWIVCSCLVACLGAIIALVVTIPKECNPNLPWYQGKVFYEVFPASFKDSNHDGIGDLKGLIIKLDYIQELGASAIRLNNIYAAQKYPDQYYNITSLVEIDRSLGVLKDFKELAAEIHKRNMSIILDVPVISLAKPLSSTGNFTETLLVSDEIGKRYVDPTSAALIFWKKLGVDGFYLKGLERFVDELDFGRTLQIWKQLIANKILIASESALDKAKDDSLNVLLSRIDLIDIHLDLQEGINGLKRHIDKVIGGILWGKPHYPWVHWNIGSVENERISAKNDNNTLALTALEFVLPGTVSIFYGDEIGLGGLENVEGDFHEHKDVHNLAQMSFSDGEKPAGGILPWNGKSAVDPNYNFLKVIKEMTKVRLNTPTIYLNAIYKEGSVQKNIELRKMEGNLVVIERWFPRRNTCVFVGNFGNSSITTDLSSMFYGGTVIAGTNVSLVGQVLYFEQVTFPANSAIVLKLEK
ncbi:unnamed protein product [Arctia plantaginis]|uniref:Glycosyl hydrolase family 13 catalytic domain-containing protein n=1 Tax=Arctia plantaginis TaxID=874455 RepID=A0A8S1AJJ2_ARCPL|nr:unnamed protein product [Arctia plantaginis]CAB3247945.1 unnamed protein product [Arctia plantaginis]